MNNVVFFLPFVRSVEEVRRAKALIDFPIKLGVVIATPAAALEIESILKEGVIAVHLDLDGLTYLAMGEDADNQLFSSHFARLEPGVRQLVEHVLEEGRKYRVQVAVQGEACHHAETRSFLGDVVIVTDAEYVNSLQRE